MLSRSSGALERAGGACEILASRAPTPPQRAALERRAGDLDAALTPAGVEEAKRLVAALFAMIPSGKGEAATTAEQIKLYAGMLAGYPPFAIGAACRGVVESGAEYRPAAGALVKRAAAACAEARREAAQIRELLGARVARDVPPEERARIAAQFRAVVGVAHACAAATTPAEREALVEKFRGGAHAG